MKKAFFLAIFIFSFSFLSAEQSFLSFSAGISSGGVFYTDPETNAINTSIGTPTPFNIGASAYINLNPTKEITFFVGTDFFFCINSKNNQTFNHLFMNIPFGVKIYPNLKGFGVGVAYVPGFRKDFIKADEYPDLSEVFYSWTNGFKFSLEYNFAHGELSKFMPTVGVSWTYMPRKNFNYDHFLTAFFHVNF